LVVFHRHLACGVAHLSLQVDDWMDAIDGTAVEAEEDSS
jgi:hypothetical protein